MNGVHALLWVQFVTLFVMDDCESWFVFYLLWFELLWWTLSRSQSVSSLLLLLILLAIELLRWLMMLLSEDSSKNPEPPDDAVQSGSLDILFGSLRIFDVTIRDDRRTVGLSIFNTWNMHVYGDTELCRWLQRWCFVFCVFCCCSLSLPDWWLPVAANIGGIIFLLLSLKPVKIKIKTRNG